MPGYRQRHPHRVSAAAVGQNALVQLFIQQSTSLTFFLIIIKPSQSKLWQSHTRYDQVMPCVIAGLFVP